MSESLFEKYDKILLTLKNVGAPTEAFLEIFPRSHIQGVLQKLKNDNHIYSFENFRSRKAELEFNSNGIVKNGTPTVYSYDCLKYISAEYPKFVIEQQNLEKNQRLALASQYDEEFD